MNKEENNVLSVKKENEDLKKETSKQFETNINFFGNGMYKD